MTGDAIEASRPDSDPLSWKRTREDEFAERAALGLSHVIYEMSPGGVVESAERTAAYRDEIEAAADRHGVDPDLLEAVIFLESAGRPDVSAGPTPDSAAGLAQIIPSTATDLLGMSVDLAASIALTRQILRADSPAEADRLRAERAAVDERFDPEAAIEGAATLPGDRPRELRPRGPGAGLLPHGDREPRERARRVRGRRRHRRDRLRAAVLRLRPRIPPGGLRDAPGVQRRVGRLPVEGLCLAGDHGPLARRPGCARCHRDAGDEQGDARGDVPSRERDAGVRGPRRDRGRDRGRRAAAAAGRAGRWDGSRTRTSARSPRSSTRSRSCTGPCAPKRWRR